jgi:GGDEF domain-containing protein
VISIRKYLQADRQAEESLAQLCRVLLAGMEQSAAQSESAESTRVLESTQSVLAGMDAGVPTAELLENASRTVAAFQQHHCHVVEQAQWPVADLRAQVKVLTAAITEVSSSSHENIRRLQQIKDKVLSVMDVKELRTLRSRLGECLDSILVAAEHQRAETARAVEQVNRSLLPAVQPSGAPDAQEPVDPATGLPPRAHAEDAIAQACQNGIPAFVVLMVVNRVHALNQSFGDDLGDGILKRFSGFVRQQLPVVDQVFRWTGPALAVLVRRNSTVDTVRAEIDSLLAQKLEHTLTTISRTVQIPISARWTVMPLVASPRLLFHKMDSFVDF